MNRADIWDRVDRKKGKGLRLYSLNLRPSTLVLLL